MRPVAVLAAVLVAQILAPGGVWPLLARAARAETGVAATADVAGFLTALRAAREPGAQW